MGELKLTFTIVYNNKEYIVTYDPDVNKLYHRNMAFNSMADLYNYIKTYDIKENILERLNNKKVLIKLNQIWYAGTVKYDNKRGYISYKYNNKESLVGISESFNEIRDIKEHTDSYPNTYADITNKGLCYITEENKVVKPNIEYKVVFFNSPLVTSQMLLFPNFNIKGIVDNVKGIDNIKGIDNVS